MKDLPKLHFKRYLGSMIFNLNELEEPLLEEIITLTNNTKKKLLPGELLVVLLTIYDGGWEIRYWLDPDSSNVMIVTNINESYKPENTYRVLVELFSVGRDSLDSELARLNTLSIPYINISFDELYQSLAGILKIPLTAGVQVVPVVESNIQSMSLKEQESVEKIQKEKIIAEGSINECVNALWSACYEKDCKAVIERHDDIIDILHDLGIIIYEFGNKFLCILYNKYDSGGCKYKLYYNDSGSIEIECTNSEDDVVEKIMRAEKRGLELVIY